MKTYYRLMLGQKSVHAQTCFDGNFIGADYGITEDLAGNLPDAWQEFNAKFIPVFLASHPAKTKIAAGLACGMLWTIAKGIQKGDIVLCPDGSGRYRAGEVSGDYLYVHGGVLPHRRPVHWLPTLIDRADMSGGLKNTTGSIGTLCNISRAGFADEIEKLLGGATAPSLIATDADVEDPSAFAMEKHLEDSSRTGQAPTSGRPTTFTRRTANSLGNNIPQTRDHWTYSRLAKTRSVYSSSN
jgi:restriction system protein